MSERSMEKENVNNLELWPFIRTGKESGNIKTETRISWQKSSRQAASSKLMLFELERGK